MIPSAIPTTNRAVAALPPIRRLDAVRPQDARGPVLILGVDPLLGGVGMATNGSNGGPEACAAGGLTGDLLRAMVIEQGISEVVIADREVETRADLVEALLDCKGRGVRIREGVTIYEERFRKVQVEALTPRSLLYTEPATLRRAHRWFKRALDLVLGSALVVAAAPIMALVAAVVRLESDGPVIFRQERVGLGGKTFRILKFRSMRQDAEAGVGPQWARVEDDRTTRVGGFLRRHHLDELPQLFNVLKGEMSLIGPRPERPCFVELLSGQIPYFGLRHHVRPGITGWAQVEYAYGASIKDAWEKARYDLYYTKNASVGLDLLILLKTVKAVLAAKGR